MAEGLVDRLPQPGDLLADLRKETVALSFPLQPPPSFLLPSDPAAERENAGISRAPTLLLLRRRRNGGARPASARPSSVWPGPVSPEPTPCRAFTMRREMNGVTKSRFEVSKTAVRGLALLKFCWGLLCLGATPEGRGGWLYVCWVS